MVRARNHAAIELCHFHPVRGAFAILPLAISGQGYPKVVGGLLLESLTPPRFESLFESCQHASDNDPMGYYVKAKCERVPNLS